MDEKESIQKVCAGDADAYRPLVERYQTGLIIYCERIVGQREPAEDVAQEAFIRAYEKLSDFDSDKAAFSTWLYKIAYRKCLDHIRKSKRYQTVDAEKIAAELEPVELHLDEQLMVSEAVDALRPPEYMKVVKGYFWHGKSYDQLAQELDTTTNTIGVWLHRAKQQLKEVLSS